MPLFLTGLGSTTTASSIPATPGTVLGMCLSVIHNTPIHGTRGYGVFRM